MLCKNLPTSSAADFGHRDGLRGKGDKAGACAQGIWNSFTTRWLITASTPANRSIPWKVQGRIRCKCHITDQNQELRINFSLSADGTV